MLTTRSFPFQFDQSDHQNTFSPPSDFEIIPPPPLLNTTTTNTEPPPPTNTPPQYPSSSSPISSSAATTTVPTAFLGGCFIPIPPGKVPPSPDALLIAATMGLSTQTADEYELYAELSKHTHPIQAFTMMQGSTAPYSDDNDDTGDANGGTTTGTIRTMLVDSYETVKIASGDGEFVSKVTKKKKKNGLLKSLFGGNSNNKKKKESPAQPPTPPIPPPPMLVYAVEERKNKRRDMMRYNDTREEDGGSTLTSMVASIPLYTAFHMMKTMPGKLMLLATTMNNGNNRGGKKQPSSSSSNNSNKNTTNTTTASPTPPMPMPMQGFTNLNDLQLYTIQGATINYHITNSTNTNTTTIAMMPLFLSFRQANNIVQKHIRHMIRARLVTRRIERIIQCARTEAMAAIVIGGVGGGRGAPPSFPSRGSSGGGGGSDDEEAMEEPPEVTEMIQEMMSSVEDQFFTGGGAGGDEMGGGGGGYPPPSSSSSFRGAGRSAPGGGGPVGRALATLVCGSVSLVARTGLVVGNVLDSIAASTPLLQRQFLLGNSSSDGTDNGNGTGSTTIKEGAILPQVVQISLSDVLHDIQTHNQSEADMLVQQGRVKDREEYNKRIASAAVWMGLRMKSTLQSVMMTRGLVKAISEATASLMQAGSGTGNGSGNGTTNNSGTDKGLAFPLPILQNIQNLVMEKNNYFGEDDPDLHYWLSLLNSDGDGDNSTNGNSRNSRKRGGGGGDATLVSKQLLVLNEDGGGRIENVPTPDSDSILTTTLGNNNNNNAESKTKDVLALIEMAVMGLNGHSLYDCINTTTNGTSINIAEEGPPQESGSVDDDVIKSGEEELNPTFPATTTTTTTTSNNNKYRRVAEVLHELGASGGVEIQGLEVPPRAVDAMQVIRSMSGGGGFLGERKRRDIGRNGVKGMGLMIISDTRNWEMDLDNGMKMLGG